jgi:hypothetical protein
MKSFGLFTVFMDRPDVKERLGKYHSYILETYIAKNWMANKEKLLLYNRLSIWNFNQYTLCPAEHEKSSMKWGEMVVNPQQHIHQTVHTINKKSNSRFTVKEGHDANNLDATHNWFIINTYECVSKYAEGRISFQWSQPCLYMIIIISSRIWRVMPIISDGDEPAVRGENDVHPRRRRV